MTQFIHGGVFLAALNLLAGNIPGINSWLSHLSGVTSITAWICLYMPLTFTPSSWNRLARLILVLSFAALLSGWLFLPGISLLVFSLAVLSGAESEQKRQELSVYLLTLVFYTVYHILYRFSPHVWYFIHHLSLGFSTTFSGLVGNRMTLGASALGIPLTISMLCYSLALFFCPVPAPPAEASGAPPDKRETFFLPLNRRGNLMLLFLSILGILGSNVFYLWLVKPLSDLVLLFQKTWKPTPFHFQAVLLILLWAATFLINRKRPKGDLFAGLAGKGPNEGRPLWIKTANRRHGYALILVFLAALTLAFSPEGSRKQGRIIFNDRGTNWSVPVYGKRYGQNSMGMFGLLPEYLKMKGYRTAISGDPVTEETLRDSSILAVFNPEKKFSPEEKELILQFVENGGSLVVAGDHTDVKGVMKPINDLIEPFNILLNFDTALPLATGWVDCLEKRPHAMTLPLDHDYETAIWVGASLATSLPATPVIVGKRGWADMGNYRNVKRAYLGDYRRSPGEQLGDLVLVAQSEQGRGKVLVFGDTSTFQNGVLASNHHFVDALFGWLNRKSVPAHGGWRLFAALLLFMAGAFLAGKSPSPILPVLCVTAMGLAPAMVITGHTGNAEAVPNAPVSSNYKPAYIDISHHEWVSLSASADNSLFGIEINLMRNRYMPLLMREFSPETLAKSDLFFVIAPTSAFTPEEVDDLRRFMENGGTIIWSVGWEEAAGSRSFLDEFGLSIDSVPLGRGTVTAGGQKIEFLEAWPVTGGDGRVLARKFDYPVILHQPVGRGGVILIGDSEFLHSRNMESYRDSFRLNNIRYFRHLLKQLNNQSDTTESGS